MVAGAPIPIRLGAGASGVAAGLTAAIGTFPPLTTRAGVAGVSEFSATSDVAGAEAVLTALLAAAELPFPVLRSFSSAEECGDLPRVMSGCETGASVVAAGVVPAG